MLKSAILRLKEKVSENTNISKSNIQDTKPDLEKLNGEVTKLLEAGSLLPEKEKIEIWALSQGLEEAEATVFAGDTVNSYFENSEEETKSKEKKEKELEEKIQKSELFFEEVKNTFEILKAGQETLAEAISYLLEKSEENTNLKTEILTLKSQIGNLSKEKNETKNPVTTQIQKSNLNGVISHLDKDKISNRIIELIKQGKCRIEDLSFFESTHKLSERVQKFCNEEYKENQI
ncbi:hypothetical protein [Leptospira mayottensis]|uniref:Uncharacterized protein n=2 Tax=Leptospira mayottensis TaxID=1137606 RepID=A0AA87SVL1_9LEPT|nr:hypothetical protein [Leptospira mayottensis]AXR66565.1 hypothetical protein DQM28_20380 [Leptospira mayottensis]AXR66637.1 hypothetical protein DQM28_20830 [Leptospira mayottensis]AZQ04201.1 hypothetical protein LEP1GSC190_19295 [Leptospira mayottensis 200901116]EKR98096.1 hypothetical protein LEP1GSC125_1553 [Leptospira mayottensis 200901122]TGN04321.1 hypothetical protein EHR03_10790 [Leptospira mayottensis]